ncbi:DUF6516 family protein [Ferriphaselus sp. R-1]|uniref:toxin-antitoxin system TumE family protein n=1 Tax=Ferriphaselus sp. R-1 TaxID=1485544 RepID=UPI000550B8D1|nr:DUF6516 family protein [Ferriphaselus sp. R-1]
MNAQLLYREKRRYAGGIIELVVWKVPEPVPPSEHPFKYRLVFVRDGQRIVGYDNERGKGDHKHLGEIETPYLFRDETQLLQDFWQDVMEATK